MANFNKDIGSKIVMARNAAGLSQRELAGKLKISQQVLSGYECGRTAISLKTFVDLCKVLDAPIAWFIPFIRQYGEIIGKDEIELLNELKHFADLKALLLFLKQCRREKQSNVKSRRILPKDVSVR